MDSCGYRPEGVNIDVKNSEKAVSPTLVEPHTITYEQAKLAVFFWNPFNLRIALGKGPRITLEKLRWIRAVLLFRYLLLRSVSALNLPV